MIVTIASIAKIAIVVTIAIVSTIAIITTIIIIARISNFRDDHNYRVTFLGCHIFKVLYCHIVILLCCHVIMLSCCWFAMCRVVALLCCELVMLWYCHVVILLSCQDAELGTIHIYLTRHVVMLFYWCVTRHCGVLSTFIHASCSCFASSVIYQYRFISIQDQSINVEASNNVKSTTHHP